jgi:hypothetical protein
VSPQARLLTPSRLGFYFAERRPAPLIPQGLRRPLRDCGRARKLPLVIRNFREPLAQIVGIHNRHQLGRGVKI